MAAFAEWLNQKFIQWELERGRRGSVTEFARHLGISQQVVSSYMSGAYLPKGEKLGMIAEKLGVEVYEVMGMARPAVENEQVKRLTERIMAEPVLMEFLEMIYKSPKEESDLILELLNRAAILYAKGDDVVRKQMEETLQGLKDKWSKQGCVWRAAGWRSRRGMRWSSGPELRQ